MIIKMKKKKSTLSIQTQQEIFSTETLPGKNELLTALFDYSIKLSSVPFSENFYVVAANELKRVFGALGVTISTFDPESSTLILQ